MEDYQEETTQELTKVKNQIKNTLQKQDIAAFLLIKVEDLLSAAKENGEKLADIAKKEGLTVETTDFLEANNNPSPKATGLTENILFNKDEPLQLQEIKDDVYLIEVKEYQTSRYPELQEIKENLITTWNNERSEELALAQAEEFLTTDLPKTLESFTSQLEEKGAELVKVEAVKLSAPGSNNLELRDPDTQEALSSSEAGVISEVFGKGSEKYIFYLSKIISPSEEDITEGIEANSQKYNQESNRKLYQALVDSLKSQAEIEIAGNLAS